MIPASLRARVEAAQKLAAKATPGPYHLEVAATPAGETPWGEVVLRHHPAGGAGTPIPGLRVTWQGRAAWGEPGRANASLLAAAPDLVTLATDILAVAESQAAQLAAIRAALGNGADEAAWPPGLTLAEAVGRLRGEHHSLRDVLQWVNDQCPGKCSAVCDSALRASHEGPHAEALGDGGGDWGGR